MHIFSFETFSLLEGGKAFDSVRRILKDEVGPTVDDIRARLLPAINIDNKSVLRMGSAGKKASSGDIDIGIMGLNQDAVEERIRTKFPNSKIKRMNGLQIVSVTWPICGNSKNGWVQVDLIPVKNMEWSEFVYRYPENSKYTSSHRNWLLMAIMSQLKSNETMLNGDVSGYDGYTFKLNDGLYSVKKSKIGKTTKMLKHAKTESEKFMSLDPRVLVKLAFGEGYKLKDVRTTEQILDIIDGDDFKYADKRDEILDRYKEFLERQKMEVPTEMV